MLGKTNMIFQQNMKGEHLLLFLVKTVGRQLIEQENYGRRNRNRASANQAGQTNDNYPERDLEPPKFADRALKLCLSSWTAIKSLIMIGMKRNSGSTIITDELFHLGAQNGSTHLDKFVFTLLNKCTETHLDMFLNTLIAAASKTGSDRDPDVDDMISRFIRSVIRVFSLITLIAPSTLALTIQSAASNAEDENQFKYSTSAGEISKPGPTRTAVAISGVISLVRSIPIISERNKDKKRNVNIFALKCRRIFQAIPTYSIAELLNTADAYMGPVRTGFINPTLNISRGMHSTDALEYIEKFLNGEQDLSSMIDGENKLNRRRRYGSRRDGDDEVVNVNENANAQHGNESEESESDSETEAVSRRFSSQGSLHGHTTASLNNIAESYRRNETEVVPNNASRQPGSSNVDREYSTDSVSSDDEENEDSSDDDESENERNFNVIDPFNNEEFEDDEDMRDNDEEEEDYYDDDGDEEAVNEFADEAENENDEDDNEDIRRNDVPVVEIEPADPVPDQEEGEIVGNEMEVGNVVSSENIHPEETVEMNDDELMNDMQNDTVNVTIAPESEAVGIAVSNDGPDVSRTRMRIIQASSGNRSRNLTWAVPGEFQANHRDGNGNDLLIRTSTVNGTDAGNNDPNTVRTKTGSSTNVVDDAHASNEKTAFQFAAVFSALIKLIDDLLLQLTHPARVSGENEKAFTTTLKTDIKMVKILRDHVDQKLASSWQWLTIVLDKVEAQLRFGSALNTSALSNIEIVEKKTEKERKYKTKEQSAAAVQKKETPHGRREFLQYFFSIARAHAGENGDELPIIEYRALRTASFVAEAFLFHASVLELIDYRIQQKISYEERMEISDNFVTSNIPLKKMRQFYQRSNSICYPCISFADNHNAFQYSAEECLPLSVRPQLLQPETEKCHLFALPVPQRSREEHFKAAENHGISNPTFHSLADLPTSYRELREFLSSGLDSSSVPERSLMKTYMSDEKMTNTNNLNVDDLLSGNTSASRLPLQKLLGRWSNAFSLITQMHTDDLVHYCGGDATFSVILVETAGFHFRQAQFRKRIEKLKNGQPRDLTFTGMCRDKNTLVVQTFRLLNQQYHRRVNSYSGNNGSNIVLKMYARGMDSNGQPAPPLASSKVKVTFKDEPGEGTGVARSFYSAVAEALTTLPHMPQDGFDPEDEKKLKSPHPSNQTSTGTPKRLARGTLQSIQSSITRRVSTRKRQELNTKADPYYPPQQSNINDSKPESRAALASNRALAGERLFNKVVECEPVYANKVTGMLLELPMNDILNMISCEDTMKAYLVEAIKLLQAEGYINSTEKENDSNGLRDDAPFFTRIESSGHYVPVPATCSDLRINGFRNVGRMIGICLQQREIFPIQLARHVLKFILGKPLNWYDLAFFDPALFDSMRQLLYDESTGNAHPHDFYEMLALNYTVTFSEKEVSFILWD